MRSLVLPPMTDVQQLITELELEFADRNMFTPPLLLLKPTDAVLLIDAAHQLGLVLAGVEGFFITPEGACQPQQELSNDRADCGLTEKEFLELTKQLILGEGERKNAVFEVVFEGTGVRRENGHCI